MWRCTPLSLINPRVRKDVAIATGRPAEHQQGAVSGVVRRRGEAARTGTVGGLLLSPVRAIPEPRVAVEGVHKVR